MLTLANVKLAACRAAVGVMVGVPIAAIMFALFWFANYHSLGRNVPAAEANVRAAYASGVLQDVDWLPGNTDIGRHQFNDCLILYMAIDQQAPADELTAGPIKPVPRGTQSMCGALRAYVAGDKAAGRTGIWYYQYLHGHTMLARYLLPHLSVEAIRNLYHLVQTLIVLAGIVLTMLALARGRRPIEALFWLIVFFAFARWFGLESYGQSLSHAPSDAVILGYALFLAAASTCGGLGRWGSVSTAALFGALVAIFEFLTGGIPLGLAIVVGGLPFALRDGETTERVIEAAAAFCAAVLACLVFKMLLALWVFGLESFSDSAAQLSARLGVGVGEGTAKVDLGPVHMAKSLVKGLSSLAAGMHVMAGLILVIAAGFGIWGARRLLASGDPVARLRTQHLLASNLVIAALLMVFWQHTIIHAWFMERTLVWTIGTGFALFALAVVQRRQVA